MTDMSAPAWAAKGAGAVAGSAVSLACIQPSGRREAVCARVGAASFITDDEKCAAVGYGVREE